jgi:hypothetical protein
MARAHAPSLRGRVSASDTHTSTTPDPSLRPEFLMHQRPQIIPHSASGSLPPVPTFSDPYHPRRRLPFFSVANAETDRRLDSGVPADGTFNSRPSRPSCPSASYLYVALAIVTKPPRFHLEQKPDLISSHSKTVDRLLPSYFLLVVLAHIQSAWFPSLYSATFVPYVYCKLKLLIACFSSCRPFSRLQFEHQPEGCELPDILHAISDRYESSPSQLHSTTNGKLPS